MDNSFLNQLFDWNVREGRWIGRINANLLRFKSRWLVRRQLDPGVNMTTLEQRISLWHLAEQPLAYGVPGDFVELGCFDGKTAAIFARALERESSQRMLHLFDSFQVGFHLKGRDIAQELRSNFQAAGCVQPQVHPGDFSVTVPAELPQEIAFVHIDCGFGGDVEEHRKTVLALLDHVYPRMPRGAIGTLMDYFDPDGWSGPRFNPGAGLAAREFFANRPEKMMGLWGGEFTHGFFRKL